MDTVTFQGWTRNYTVNGASKYRAAVEKHLEYSRAQIDGEITFGISLSQLAFQLRFDRFQVPGKECDQISLYKALGYKVTDAKVGKHTKGGFQYCVPAQVVTL